MCESSAPARPPLTAASTNSRSTRSSSAAKRSAYPGERWINHHTHAPPVRKYVSCKSCAVSLKPDRLIREEGGWSAAKHLKRSPSIRAPPRLRAVAERPSTAARDSTRWCACGRREGRRATRTPAKGGAVGSLASPNRVKLQKKLE